MPGIQIRQHRVVDGLCLLRDACLRLPQYVRNISVVQVALRYKALPCSRIGGIYCRTAYQDDQGKQANGKSLHGTSEII